MPCASLLDTRELTSEQIHSLFERADRFEATARASGNFYDAKEAAQVTPRTVAGLFLEASTRTRMSFQMAAQRLGHRTLVMDGGVASSMSKGETDVDTVLNIAAMKPDAIVIRYNASPGLDELLPTLSMPVISAGSGARAHPTQALLDAYTIRNTKKTGAGSFQAQRILIVGDVSHSRVARSNFDVLNKLGAEIGVCGPADWLPTDQDLARDQLKVRRFENLDEALSWPTVYIGLRIQLERHQTEPSISLAGPTATGKPNGVKDYHERFGLTVARLKKLSNDVTIMHPGPINHGVEFCDEVMRDPRARILEQVTNGVLIRAALLERALGGSSK